MRNKQTLSILLALIVAASFLVSSGCSKKPEGVGTTGTDFTLSDIDGNQVRLSDYRGKVVVLEFWATWCPPCRLAIPELNDLNNRLKDRDFALITLSINEDPDKVRAFADEYKINYTVLIDDQDVSSEFGVRNIPTTFILDKEGNIVSKHLGYISNLADVMEEEIKELL